MKPQHQQFHHIKISGNRLHVTVPTGIHNIVPMLRQQLHDALIMARASGTSKRAIGKFRMALEDQMYLLDGEVKRYMMELKAAEVDPEMSSEQRDYLIYETGNQLASAGAKILAQILDITRLTNSNFHGEAKLVQPNEIRFDKEQSRR